MPTPQWTGLFLLACGYALALTQGGLGLPVLLPLIGLALAAWLVRAVGARWRRTAGHCLFVMMAISLALHWLPGFDNAPVYLGVRFTPDATPFTMYLNLDKPLIGFWLLLTCPWIACTYALRRGASAMAVAVALPLTAVVCLGGAWAAGMLAWAPKWPAQAWVWALNNLLLVSLTEEALFRGYLQGGLQRWLRRLPQGDTLALVLAAGLFGLTHLGAGWQWALLAGLAGAGYGLAYRYGGLLAATATHFGLNLVHFAGFTYPQLAPA